LVKEARVILNGSLRRRKTVLNSSNLTRDQRASVGDVRQKSGDMDGVLLRSAVNLSMNLRPTLKSGVWPSVSGVA
jgi:hypothetical protein